MSKFDGGFELIKDIGNLNEINKGWTKNVSRGRWNGGSETLNIRNIRINDDGSMLYGKGIAINEEEADELCNLLLKEGYGDTDILEEALERKTKRISVSATQFNKWYDEEVEVELGVE